MPKTEVSKETFEFYGAFLSGAILLLTALIFSLETVDGYLLIKSVTAQSLIIMLAAIYLLYIVYRHFVILTFRKCYPALLVYFLMTLLSSALAINWQVATLKSFETLLWLFFFWILSQGKLPARKLFIISIALALGSSLIAGYAILMRLGLTFFGENVYLPISTLGNVSFCAQWLAPLIPLTLALILECGPSILSGLLLFSMCLMLGTLLLTKSMTSILALGCGCLAVYALLLPVPTTIGHLKRKLLKPLLLFLFCLLIGGSLYWNQANTNLHSRLRTWVDSTKLIQDNWLVGVGRNNFFSAYAPYISKQARLNQNEYPSLLHAHNEFLEISAESGLLGGLAFLSFLFVVYSQLRSFFSKQRENHKLVAGFGAGWLVMTLNAFTSYNLHNPATGVMFWFLGGSLISMIDFTPTTKRTFERIEGVKWVVYGSTGLFSLLALFYVYYPLAADIKLKKALRFQEDGQLADAAGVLQEAIHISDTDYTVHLLLGNILRQQGDLDKAIKAYQKSLKLSPNQPQTYNNIGQLYQQLGQGQAAADAYSKALQINPYYLEALNNLGSLYAQATMYQEAEEIFLKLLDNYPKQAEVYYNLGNLMMSQDKDEQALGYYVQAIAANPRKAPFHNNLGALYLRTKRYEQAIKEFKKTIKLDPGFVSAFNNLGNTYLEMGLIDEAITQYNHALEVEPGYLRAQFNLASAYERQGDLDRAVQIWRQISRPYPDSSEGQLAIQNLIRVGKLRKVTELSQ